MMNRFCVFISIFFKVFRISEICEEGQVGGDPKGACGNSFRHAATGETSLRHTYDPKASVLRRDNQQKLISNGLLLSTVSADRLQYGESIIMDIQTEILYSKSSIFMIHFLNY